jgi:hypothetical protein
MIAVNCIRCCIMPDVPGELPDLSLSDETVPGDNMVLVKILAAALLSTVMFTTAGIWLIDRYFIRLDDLQWIVLILIPWGLFILVLTTALVFQIARGVFAPWRNIRK